MNSGACSGASAPLPLASGKVERVLGQSEVLVNTSFGSEFRMFKTKIQIYTCDVGSVVPT